MINAIKKHNEGRVAQIKVETGIPQNPYLVAVRTPSSIKSSYTSAAYERRNPATKKAQSAVRFFDIKSMARKATIPPANSFIMNNNILGSIIPHIVIIGLDPIILILKR